MKKLSLIITLLIFAFATQAQTDTVRIACIGNSITYGSGIKNRSTDSYPAQLGRLLGDKCNVVNFGLGGRTLLNKGDRPYMKESLFKKSLEFNPHIVIIKLGTNDTKPFNWKYSSEFKGDLTTMINSYKNLPSKPVIYLCYPAKAYFADWGINDTTIVNEVIPFIKEVAKSSKSKIIDLHAATSNMPENFPDKIHPNATGAGIMAKVVQKAIIRDVKKISKKLNR